MSETVRKSVRDLLAPDERLIFIRGGYSQYYDSRRDTEPPRGGGSHNDDGTGCEWNNFRPHNGQYYVYGWSGGEAPLNLRRLGAGPGTTKVGRVTVVQVATRPGHGQVVVGWYRGATAHADWQYRPFARTEVCCFTAPVDQAVLLPDHERTIHVPKGKGAMGQSHVCYDSDASGRLDIKDWMVDVLTAIRRRESTRSPVARPAPTPRLVARSPIGQGRGLTKPQRDAVERFAMARATEHYKKLYDSVIDVHTHEPFDLRCSNRRGGHELRVEVKGTTGGRCTVLVTRGEVDAARTHHTALFIASGLAWADKTAAVLKPGGWRQDVIDPWAPTPQDLVPTAFEWHNPTCKENP